MQYDIKRVSGIRSNAQTALQGSYERKALEIQLNQKYTPLLFEAVKEPYFMDDAWKGVHPSEYWKEVLHRGEFFSCTADGELIGFMCLTNIIIGRSAEWQYFILPAYRRTGAFQALAKELVDYATKPFPEGLGLVKLKAFIAAPNTPSLRAIEKLGGQVVGSSPFDGLYTQEPTDMLTFELYAPGLFKQEEVINGRETVRDERTDTIVESEPAVSPDIPSASSVHESGSIPGSGAVHQSRGADSGSDIFRLQPGDGRADNIVRSGSRQPSTDGLTDLEREFSSFA